MTSERDLPIRLYQTGAKFRDEMRPKFGLMRATEFRMKAGLDIIPCITGWSFDGFLKLREISVLAGPVHV